MSYFYDLLLRKGYKHKSDGFTKEHFERYKEVFKVLTMALPDYAICLTGWMHNKDQKYYYRFGYFSKPNHKAYVTLKDNTKFYNHIKDTILSDNSYPWSSSQFNDDGYEAFLARSNFSAIKKTPSLSIETRLRIFTTDNLVVLSRKGSTFNGNYYSILPDEHLSIFKSIQDYVNGKINDFPTEAISSYANFAKIWNLASNFTRYIDYVNYSSRMNSESEKIKSFIITRNIDKKLSVLEKLPFAVRFCFIKYAIRLDRRDPTIEKYLLVNFIKDYIKNFKSSRKKQLF